MWRAARLDIVTQADAVEANRSVREDLDRFALGQVMLEAVDRSSRRRRRPRVFQPPGRGPEGPRASGQPLVLACSCCASRGWRDLPPR